MIGLNEMISEMVDQKNEVLSQYESIVKQKKVYKRMMKDMKEEYDGYQTMLEGDYELKIDEELER